MVKGIATETRARKEEIGNGTGQVRNRMIPSPRHQCDIILTWVRGHGIAVLMSTQIACLHGVSYSEKASHTDQCDIFALSNARIRSLTLAGTGGGGGVGLMHPHEFF